MSIEKETHPPSIEEVRESWCLHEASKMHRDHSDWYADRDREGKRFDAMFAAEIRRAEVKALRAARIELGTLANSTLVAPWELMNALDARIKRFEAA